MLSKSDLKNIKILIDESLNENLKPIKKDIRKLDKKSDIVITSFDREYIHLRKRVDRVEDHLSLPPFPSDL